MNDDLAAWFAKADDVLTNWCGSTDAMRATVPESDDVEALPGESYYDQMWSLRLAPLTRVGVSFNPVQMAAFGASMEQFREGCRRLGEQMRQGSDGLRKLLNDMTEAGLVPDRPPSDPRARALWARQNRNTGPPSRVGLDGRYR